MSAQHVVVIGGGITGMAASYYLERQAERAGRAIEITLVERDGKLGGKVGTENIDGYLLDTGPDSFLDQKPWAVDLCRALGMEDQIIHPLARRFYILHRGKLHAVPHELVSLVPTKPEALWRASFLSLAGKARASAEGLVRARRDQDDESLSSFMRRRFGAEFALRFAEPLMGGVHAGHPERMSMASIYPMYWQMERKHGSVTRAILQRRRAAAKNGSAPSRSPFVALRGGMSSLLDRLAKAYTVTRVRTGVEVQGVMNTAPTAALNESIRVALSDGDAIDASAVIVTSPAFDTARLIEPLSAEAASHLRAIPYASTAVVSLAYPERNVGCDLDGSGFLVPRGEPMPITGCTWSSRKWEGRAPEGMVLMRAFMGNAGEDRFVEEQSEDELAASAHNALARLLRIEGEPAFRRVYRWIRSMPQYEVGHGARVAAIERALAGLPQIVLAGSALRGVGVPDCIRQGQEAAERVMGGES